MANDWEALADIASTRGGGPYSIWFGGPYNTWSREAAVLRRVFEGCPEDRAGTFIVTIRGSAGDCMWVVKYSATSTLEYCDTCLSAVICALLQEDLPPEMPAKCMAVLDMLRAEYLGYGF